MQKGSVGGLEQTVYIVDLSETWKLKTAAN